MKLSVPSFAAGVLAASVLVALPATALLGSTRPDPTATTTADQHPDTYDGTAPSFTLRPVRFRVGSSIDAAQAPGAELCQSSPWNFSIPLRLRWSGNDATSGLASYDLWGAGAYWNDAVKLVEGTQATSQDLTGYNYDGDCGGGTEFDRGYWVVAHDHRGNTASSSRVRPNVDVWQETGLDELGDPGLPVTRTGTWRTARCTCFNNGATLYSTTAGASLTYTLTATRPGQTVALVMEKNTNRGSARVSVDGGPATTLDTQASSPPHRVIVWQRLLGVGTHTVTVTNAGTAGHSRVAVDSVMLTLGQVPGPPPSSG
jgi:hypothetical protein